VLVRDVSSAALVGGPSERVRVIPDPALFVPAPPEPRPEPVLGLIVRAPVQDDDARATRLVELLADLAMAGRVAGLEPRLLLMDPSADRGFAERVAGRLAQDGEGPRVLALGPGPAELWREMGELQAVGSVRLHGLLLSALAGVPCVPIAYDDKVTLGAEALGIGDLVLHPWRADAGTPADLLVAARDPSRMRAVAHRISELRDRAGSVRAILP
jgi:polysaccharide pyruvyl transferase WcaK-like protein